MPAIKTFFPNVRVVDIEAGHWVISEKPEDFRRGECVVLSFDSSTSLLTCCSGDQFLQGERGRVDSCMYQ